MATRIWKAKFVMSFGGRNVKDPFGNALEFRSEYDPFAEEFTTLGNAIINIHKTIITPDTRILRVVISPKTIPGVQELGRGYHTPVDTDTVGTRALAAGQKGVFREAVAIFKKNAQGGTSGTMAVRGAYLVSETDTSSAREITTVDNFNKATLSAYGTAMYNAFKNNGCPLVLPAPNGANKVTGARELKALVYQTIALRDATRSRTSLPQARGDLAKREINDIKRQFDDAVKNGVSTALGSDLGRTLTNMFFDAMLRYGVSLILKSSLPAPLKAIAVAAAALSGQGGRPQLPA